MNTSFEQDDLHLPYQYRAVVLDNNDPDKKGRIKVRVFGIFTADIPTDKLPWAVPAQPLFAGAGVDYGHFAVPEVNSQVFVFFEGGDVYQPVYWAEAPNGVHGLPSELQTNYPARKVLKTKNGIVIYVDDSALEVKITLPSGTYVKIGSEVKVNHSSGSYVQIDSSGNITIKGTRVDINP